MIEAFTVDAHAGTIGTFSQTMGAKEFHLIRNAPSFEFLLERLFQHAAATVSRSFHAATHTDAQFAVIIEQLGHMASWLCDFQGNLHHLGEGVLSLLGAQAFASEGIIGNGTDREGGLTCTGCI